MKQLPPVCLLFIFSAASAMAGPLEDAIVATVSLSDAANYSWSSTVSDDARTYDIEGRTIRDGFTHVRMPVVNSVRRKMGRSVTDAQIDTIFLGNVECVLLTEQGWKRPDELQEPTARSQEYDRMINSIPGASNAGLVRVAPAGRVRASRAEKERQPYSNLQLAISPPHEELSVIVGSHQSFEVSDDTVSGVLTDLGAQLLLVRDGQKEITPIRATGTFKLWLRDGVVSRYQLKLEGVLSVETPRGRTHVVVQQSALTQIHHVGTTAFQVPEAARVKLVR